MKLSMFYSLTTNFGIHHKIEGSKRPVTCYKVMSESSATTLSAAGDMPKPESTFNMTSLKCYIYVCGFVLGKPQKLRKPQFLFPILCIMFAYLYTIASELSTTINVLFLSLVC